MSMEEEKRAIWVLPFTTTLSSVRPVKDKTQGCPSFVQVVVYYHTCSNGSGSTVLFFVLFCHRDTLASNFFFFASYGMIPLCARLPTKRPTAGGIWRKIVWAE